MKKKIKNFYSGFTIAELLMSMLIAMVIAASLIPVIGPKKMKWQDSHFSHGIFECYYDENGNLHSYYADNSKNRGEATDQHVDGDSCVFRVPKSDQIEVFAIGAGTPGPALVDDSGEHDEQLGLSGDLGFTFSEEVLFRGQFGLDNFADAVDLINNFTPNHDSQNDLLYGLTDAAGANELQLGRAVKASLTFWSRMILQNTNGEWDLFAQFSNVQGPTGSSGRSYSYRHQVPGTDCGTSDACPEFKNPNFPVLYSSDSNTKNSIDFDAKRQGYSWWRAHSRGGASAQPDRLADQVRILFPIDGASAIQIARGTPATRSRDNRPEGGGENLGISITAESVNPISTNALAIQSSTPGRNAGRDEDGDNGSSPQSSLSLTQTVQNRPIKVIANGVLRRFDKDTDMTKGAAIQSPSAGPLTGDGELSEPTSGAESTINYMGTDAFSWVFYIPNVTVRYLRGGNPGEMRQMKYKNLEGSTLRLTPGSLEGVTRATFVYKTDGVFQQQHPLLVAPGGQDVNDYTMRETYRLTSDMRPRNTRGLPKDSIVEDATSSTRRMEFNQYISRINNAALYGFRGGLMNCERNNSCPGYAGGGAYPLLSDNTRGFRTLHIRNNQSYVPAQEILWMITNDNINLVSAGNLRDYYRLFAVGADNDVFDYNAARCPNNEDPIVPQGESLAGGYRPPIQGLPFFVGDMERLRFCKASNVRRNDGGVIIVW